MVFMALNPLRHRDFRLLWAGWVLSTTAGWVFQVVSMWLIFELTDSPLMLGVSGIFGSVPFLITSLYGGAFADRLNRRKLLATIAMYTHNHAAVDEFYQKVIGMRRMTGNTLNQTGKQNPSRGHINDGVIGLAVLSRYAGQQSGMDHYGFKVENLAQAQSCLAALAEASPPSASGKFVGGNGKKNEEDFHAAVSANTSSPTRTAC